MLRSQQMIVLVVVATLGGGATGAAAGQRAADIAAEGLVTTVASAALAGRIVGAVTDAAGEPLEGVVVSAFGPSGSELARSDRAGRFLLSALAPGEYLVQAHSPGFVASHRARLAVVAQTPTRHAITLNRVGPQAALEAVPATIGVSRLGQSLEGDEDTTVDDAGGTATAAPHDHSVKAWRLQRARRSVLKTTDAWVEAELRAQGIRGGDRIALAPRGDRASLRYTTGLADLPLSGQVNLLTRGLNLLTGEARPANIANLAVGAPVWNGDWSAKGAMTTGVVSSWIASGTYLSDSRGPHQLGVTASFGRQRYEGGNLAALSVPSESRYAAGFGLTDVWTVSPQLSLAAGGQYATYGYIEERALFNPRLGFTVTPVQGTRLTVVASQEHVAPGAQEFLPPSQSELWLPPERTFAALAGGGGLHPERTRHLDVAVEHDLTEHYVIGVRRFYQDVSDQMATLFGVDVIGLAPTGHYDVARAGQVSSRGWVLTLRRSLGDRVTGWVDYTLAEAEWTQVGADPGLGAASPGAIRPAHEAFHDVSGVIETEITENTRVSVRCRVSTAFARADVDEPIGMDTRFDVTVNQALPFSPIDGSRWEVLLAVRSLFFEPRDVASMFDELLVARSPKQVVGGLVVHF
ncbi:MAG: TonB-dependent receptor [Acidobacteria bacterium]|nr:TonB-dependent receptor [Acidobacteriota bacterium]